MLFIFLLALIELVFFSTNYMHGTFLMGWDNVMPEFNILLNLKRSLIGVWANYRGLGFTNGMSEIANLFHTIYIAILSIFFAKSDLRYILIIIAHLAGGIGFYLLAKKLMNNSKAAFIGALFYMFNLGVIQMFFAPLEVFIFQFAALPITAMFISKSLEKTNRKNLLYLFLTGLLFSPQGFVPTVFIVYFLLFALLAIFNFIREKNYKKILIVTLVFLASNAFWLLPYVYSGTKEALIIGNTRINEFASPEIYYRNKAYGDLKSVLTFKGFMLDTVEYDPISGKNYNFMQVWKDHYNRLYYQVSFFLIIFIAAIGFFYSFYKRKDRFYPYLSILIISFIFLANNTIPFDSLNNFLRASFPVFKEAFRFPFTKFIIIFTFSFSIFLSLGIDVVMQYIKKLRILVILFLFFLIFLLSFPAFQGQFFSPHLKVRLPSYYNQMFDYLNQQKETQRIALLPMDTFLNWRYSSWGDFGSGFIWYGIAQPILTRAFDPWSNYNEQFYNELSYAINTSDINLFNSVLVRYNIRYLLLEESFINTQTHQPINYTSLEKFIELSNLAKKEKHIGKLLLYRIDIQDFWIYALNKDITLKVYPSFLNENEDTIQEIINRADYVVSSDNPSVVPIFPSLFSGKLPKDIEFNAENTNDSIIFTSTRIIQPKNYLLRIPSLFDRDFIIPIEVQLLDGKVYLKALYPKVLINNESISINDPPIILEPEIVKNPQEIIFNNIDRQIVDPTKNGRTYILNNAINTIELIDGNEKESLNFDTNNVSSSIFFLKLPDNIIKNIKVIFPKIKSILSTDKAIQNINYKIKEIKLSDNCCKSLKEVKNNQKGISIIAKHAYLDLTFYLPDLFHQGSYVIFTKTSYNSGLPINFYVDNPFENKSELETRLSKEENVLVLPKTENYFKGYGFHFIVKSLGVEKAQSTINKFSLFPIPANFLKGIALINPDISRNVDNSSNKQPLNFNKINDSLYFIDKIPAYSAYISFSQSFDVGWKAYEVKDNNWLTIVLPFVFGKELKEHVLVNNWANGWLLNSDKRPASPRGEQATSDKLIIIFWPQYLEYLGFGILIVTFAWLLLARGKIKQPLSL